MYTTCSVRYIMTSTNIYGKWVPPCWDDLAQNHFDLKLLTSQICDISAFFLSSSEALWKKKLLLLEQSVLSVQNASDFGQDLPYFTRWSCTKRTPSPSEDTEATGPLEMLMPVIIQEFHAKSTFNKPFLRPHKNLLQSALTIFSERQALFPQCTLGNVCVQTSWPRKGRFRLKVRLF